MVGGDGGVEITGEGDVVAERQVNDRVGLGRGIAQDVEVGDLAAPDLGTGGGDRLGGTSERASPSAWWPFASSSATTCRADPARCPCDE